MQSARQTGERLGSLYRRWGGHFGRFCVSMPYALDVLRKERHSMIKFLVACSSAAILLGCSNHNVSPHTIQFASDTVSYPENYQVEAARIVRDRKADPEFARVSEPQPTLGETAFSPKRWYVCVRGIPAPKPKSSSLPPVAEIVESWVTARPAGGVYDVLLVFSGRDRPSVREGFDSPLCQNQTYAPVSAEPPLT